MTRFCSETGELETNGLCPAHNSDMCLWEPKQAITEIRVLNDLVREILFGFDLSRRSDLKYQALWFVRTSGRRHPAYGPCDNDVMGTTCSECIRRGLERWPTNVGK